jgi:twitching motility protein PilU
VHTVDAGRVAAFEILLDSPRVKDLIHKGQTAELKEAMEKSTTLGMVTFDQSLFELYRAGRISLEEALRNADSANNLRLRIKLIEDGQRAEQHAADGGSPEAERLQVDLG